MKYLLIVSTLLTVFACGGKKETGETEKKLCLSDTLVKMIETDRVNIEAVYEQIKLSGLVEVDESKMIKVYPLVGGQVNKVSVELGDYVKKGDVLAVLKSAEAAEIEKDIIGDSSHMEIAYKNMHVAEDMYKSGLMAEKDLFIAKNEYKRAKAEYERSIELYDIYSLGQNSKYIIRAPMSGFVVAKDVNTGSQLRSDNQSSIFTISNLSNVWVMANVYESDIHKIKTGYPVKIQTIAYPDKIFEGKIDKIQNVIDPASKVLKVRIVLENPQLLLKPGMFTTVLVRYTSDKAMLTIPASCIIFDHNKNYVMVYKDACKIQTKEVDVMSVLDNRAYISEGISEGDNVITKYQLLVYETFNE
jgi:membrane fusion protein, heavy metal efflux system